jgi:hypothetical protein
MAQEEMIPAQDHKCLLYQAFLSGSDFFVDGWNESRQQT